MADYKNYLAANILTEDKVVTYRLLSRVLKINVNAAKEMLFEFHRVQNAKKPGTIHATYLVSGTKKTEAAPEATNESRKDGEDDFMQSSPFMSSMAEPIATTEEKPVLSITLTREENLEKVRSDYETISSIQVYSLGPHPLKELQLLSDSTREIQTLCTSEDPLEFYPKYGIITNPNVKRRAARKAPVATSVPTRSAPPKSKLNEVQEPAKSASQSSKPEPKSQPSNAKDFFGNKGKEKAKPKLKNENTGEVSSKESTPAPPPNLKKESSSIFKAFAKTQPRKEKSKNEGTDSGAEISAKEDTPMKDASDDDDDEDTWVPPPVNKEKSDKDRKSRKEREEALRKMMEDDDEQEEEAVPSPPPVEEKEEEEEEEKEPESEKEEPAAAPSNGRRRGRRRVTKKKTVKDEDGYLVTKHEQAWESFSEDEPAPAPKPKTTTTTNTNNAAKPKKGAAGKGQGSIMSFFGKKSSD